MRWVPYWSLTTTQCQLLTLFVAISYITFITFLHILKYNKCSIYTVLCMRFVMEYKKTTAHLQHLQTIIRPLKLNYVLLTVQLKSAFPGSAVHNVTHQQPALACSYSLSCAFLQHPIRLLTLPHNFTRIHNIDNMVSTTIRKMEGQLWESRKVHTLF